MRDARINMIYEGTNTIQSLDLLGRKVLGDKGAKLKTFGKRSCRTSSRKRAPTRRCSRVRHPAGRPGRQGHQADQRTRHEGLPAPGRSGGGYRGVPAGRGSPGVWYLGARMAQGRAREEELLAAATRSNQQAGPHGPVLLRQATGLDHDGDPQRAPACRPLMEMDEAPVLNLRCPTLSFRGNP